MMMRQPAKIRDAEMPRDARCRDERYAMPDYASDATALLRDDMKRDEERAADARLVVASVTDAPVTAASSDVILTLYAIMTSPSALLPARQSRHAR